MNFRTYSPENALPDGLYTSPHMNSRGDRIPEHNQAAIMESLDPGTVNLYQHNEGERSNWNSEANISSDQESNKSSIPDVAMEAADYTTTKLNAAEDFDGRSFLLVDANEKLQVTSAESFCRKLVCHDSDQVKVVAIVGNTGEGKSHCLNHAFFDKEEVFPTSSSQSSCTLGVRAAYNMDMKVIFLDTEGMLGCSDNENQRTRLLLKILAIADIVIYRTRAERLHNDMFRFLSDASKAYREHFYKELKALSEKLESKVPLSKFGPVVIIFHETCHTEPETASRGMRAEGVLRQRFERLGLEVDSFNNLRYVGIRSRGKPTDFSSVRMAVNRELKNIDVRQWRQPSVVYYNLKSLNDKFVGKIGKFSHMSFPDQYFTCGVLCLSCEAQCSRSINHEKEGLAHTCQKMCKYQHQYVNSVYMCKQCRRLGRPTEVEPKTSASTDSTWMGLAKYAWSGYVLECKYCGIIYRSRQYWYGNRDPLDTTVDMEVRHVWPGENPCQGAQNAAQKIIDGVSYLTETVGSVSAKPTKLVTNWVTDQIAPKYWRPNADITHCHSCSKRFELTDEKHHCRACGEGFCEACSSKTKPVPERGWNGPVRVCSACFSKGTSDGRQDMDSSCVSSTSSTKLGDVPDDIEILTEAVEDVRIRKYGEVVLGTLGSMASVLDYPKGFIKDSARPSYWVADKAIVDCYVCHANFTYINPIHHCRACGQGVCDTCSSARRPVLERGWNDPVRVCSRCMSDK